MKKKKVKTIGKKNRFGLTPINISIVSLGVLIMMISIGISPKLMGNSVSRDNYMLVYNSNGGTGKMSNQIIKYGESVQLKKNSFKKDGYYFNGWRVKKSDNTWMCYIDNNITNFSWTDQSYCNKYGYVLYKDNIYVNNIVNKGETVYLYVDWKVIGKEM